MIDPIVITVDAVQAKRWFGELLQRGADLSGLMHDISETLRDSTQERFATGIGPDGIAWIPLAESTIRALRVQGKASRTPLLDTGSMRDSIFPTSGPDWAEISATARQARWHQKGTDPYTISPKNKKALSWPGGSGPRKVVNHPGLPARPFIGLSVEDGEAIEALAIAWLDTPETG